MKRIVEQHVARLRRAQQVPGELEALRDRLFARLYPTGEAALRRVRYDRIPTEAPD